MFTLTVLGLFISIASSADSADLESEKNLLKQQIISLAKSYEGQGDPDLSKQQSLEPLVQKLLSIAPQSTLKERMGILAGSWRQVWAVTTTKTMITVLILNWEPKRFIKS